MTGTSRQDVSADGGTDEQITLQKAAEELGVHYMTVYRHVRLGMLPAHKQGRSWMVRRSDLATYRTKAADGDAGASGVSGAPWRQRLEDRLVAGDGGGAWSVIEAAMASGTDPVDVYMDMLVPAMRSVGERWRAGEIGIAQEHQASMIVHRLVGRLGPRFSRPGRSRGTVVIGASSGDTHSLPVTLAADVLRGAGFEVHDLGADVPTDDFVALAQSIDDLVAVAVTATALESGEDGLRDLVSQLHDRLASVPVLVGGGAVTDEDHARSLGSDGYATDARVLAEIVGGLSVR